MANPWFRMYAEFSSDPKVQILSEPMQRRLIMLMCLKCNETIETLHETELAFALRISSTELAETKMVFIDKGFIDEDWNLLNWAKRQFASDTSTERVRAHREKKKQDLLFNGTFQKRSGNALDSDTDSEKNKKRGVHHPDWLPSDAWESFVEMRAEIGKPVTRRSTFLLFSKLSQLREQGNDPKAVLDQATEGGYSGLVAVRKSRDATPPHPNATVGMARQESASNEAQAKREQVDFWRGQRDKDSPLWKTDGRAFAHLVEEDDKRRAIQ